MVPMPAAISSTWRDGVAIDRAAVQVGNQVGHGDVEQAGGRHREDVGTDARHHLHGAEGDERAEDARPARDDVQHQRLAAAVAGGEQDGDVADFLRDFVRGDGDGGVDAERHRCHDGRADDRAVDEVVKRVADEEQGRGGAVDLAFVGVAVPEQDQLFEREEEQDAGEQRAEHRGRREQRQGFRQQRQQRHAEQRADRVADQPGHEAGPHVGGKQHERRRDEQTAAAAEKAQAERGREHMHATFYCGLRIAWTNSERIEATREDGSADWIAGFRRR